MSTEKPRFTITVDEDLLRAVDDFRFENRYATRTQAMLELVRVGLAQVEREHNKHYLGGNNDCENVLHKREKV